MEIPIKGTDLSIRLISFSLCMNLRIMFNRGNMKFIIKCNQFFYWSVFFAIWFVGMILDAMQMPPFHIKYSFICNMSFLAFAGEFL